MWLAEIRAGVYVGVYSPRTRERIWDEVVALLGGGSAAIAWAAATDSGFAFDTAGPNRREPADFDGLTLVRFSAPPESTDDAPGWSGPTRAVEAPLMESGGTVDQATAE